MERLHSWIGCTVIPVANPVYQLANVELNPVTYTLQHNVATLCNFAWFWLQRHAF